jgi:ABC-type branched-subunit amino acid transport system substrate-binding protein
LISEKTEYAQSIAAVIKDILKTKVINEISFDSSEKDFGIIATRAKAIITNIDVIIMMTQSESSTSNIIKAFSKE